jgi:hypothetical protein
VIGALTAGYVGQCLLFPYHTATHDYYHSALLIPAALGLGAAGSALWRWSRTRDLSPAVLTAVLVAVAGLVAVTDPPTYPYVETSVEQRFENARSAAEEAGRALRHSDRVLFVSRGYGSLQQYYGYLAGPAWPLDGDLFAEWTFGGGTESAEARFSDLDRAAGGLDWVLITEPTVLEEQPDLAAVLSQHFEPVRSGEGWTALRRVV